MATIPTTTVRKEEDYQTPFNRLISLIAIFQGIENATSAFQYLDQISGYGLERTGTYTSKPKSFDESLRALTRTENDGILMQDYPSLLRLSTDFRENIQLFDEVLNTSYHRNLPAVSKKIAIDLNQRLESFSLTLNHDMVKSKIRTEFTDENRYVPGEFYGLKVRECRPNVWQGFTLDLLERDYLFDDYMEWIYEFFEAITAALVRYENGYPEATPAIKQKVKAVTRPLKNGIIFYEKWDEFHTLCVDLSKTRTFKSKIGGVDIQFIQHIESEDRFKWQSTKQITNHRVWLPSLAQFIRMLLDNEFFEFPPKMRLTICANFLSFFGLTGDVKKLSKEIEESEHGNYDGIFKKDNWY